ncbi:pseudouridine synthase [Pseudomonas oryzihabitans]|uniref:Pseudouridine synthase n=1 Tax=Pseudomonas oryzihabitans TaxID=47885 RepID=A0AAJ2EV21_9PSED|nr:16S rRNA pseudouridine(516) synthase [Pseudomonas psychrotolerans]MDR6233338.1 16S rRNA pseudouridine516 synthase [Pseudomonas psychrotolerans]MDR6357643.1 16S rRNA pseudouridine516 synthase [Pseudomonas psychrotolerans]
MRLDRWLGNRSELGRQLARRLVAEGRVRVNGLPTLQAEREVFAFDRIEVEDRLLQDGPGGRYLMLHKPRGCVSATVDARHRTVLDCLAAEERADLHLAGRLDFNTTGLLLLTNDGQWSRGLSHPRHKQTKRYLVSTAEIIPPQLVAAFAEGLYFAYEDLTTQPAQLELLGERSAYLTLVEGRYHQVKRMFGRFGIEVVALHRDRIGGLALDPALAEGSYRALTADEVALLRPAD